MWETWEPWVRSLGWEDPLEEEMAMCSSILVWKIPWTEKPGGLQSKGLKGVGHDWACARAHTHTHTHTHTRVGKPEWLFPSPHLVLWCPHSSFWPFTIGWATTCVLAKKKRKRKHGSKAIIHSGIIAPDTYFKTQFSQIRHLLPLIRWRSLKWLRVQFPSLLFYPQPGQIPHNSHILDYFFPGMALVFSSSFH